MSERVRLFVGIACLSVVVAGVFVWRAGRRSAESINNGVPSSALAPLAGPLPSEPFLVFSRRSGSPDGKDGTLGVAPLTHTANARFDESIKCERVNMGGDRGICLQKRGRFPVSYAAVLFDRAFKTLGDLPLAGTPSRTQVAASGHLGAFTVFIAGHSYSDNTFSTRTSIVDLEKRQWLVEDLETWTVKKEGQVIHAPDFNFWGVTFLRDDSGFYATLGTKGRTYLVRGDFARSELAVVADDVECPSLSPDNSRVAFKHRNPAGDGPLSWSLWVLDLSTGERHPLAETRSVDDQAQWLDNGRVMYGLPGSSPALMEAWSVPADGTGKPDLVISAAYSAFVVRP